MSAWDGFDPHSTTVGEIHDRISQDAAEVANDDPRMPRLCPGGGHVWKSASSQSTRHADSGICIEYEQAWLAQHHTDLAWQTEMTQVGNEAVETSLALNVDKLAGVMLGEARRGRNYFDGFISAPPAPHEQQELPYNPEQLDFGF